MTISLGGHTQKEYDILKAFKDDEPERAFMCYIILASGSPRRSEILSRAGVSHKVIVPDIVEGLNGGRAGIRKIKEIALSKAENVRRRCKEQIPVIAADTVVCLRGRILGKPAGKTEARDMIKSLSGRWHKVITGYCVMWDECDYICGCSVTRVRFRKLDSSVINEYIQTDEPYDKAGGYGIQSLASVFVERISGCYCNVMGLPVSKILSMLKGHEAHMRSIQHKGDKE